VFSWEVFPSKGDTNWLIVFGTVIESTRSKTIYAEYDDAATTSLQSNLDSMTDKHAFESMWLPVWEHDYQSLFSSLLVIS